MAITQRFSVVCDDVRQENNGKFIVIGMYTPDMAVQQLPTVLPTLTFLLWLESDRLGGFPFTLKLEHLESGKPLAEGMGMMQFTRPGIAVGQVRLGNVQFLSPGAYTFSIHFQGQSDTLTTTFAVILNVTPPQLAAQHPT